MKNKLMLFLSHFLVGLLAVGATLLIVMWCSDDSYSKLDELEELISEKFIGEVDKTAMEDAAAGAMINALGDSWSYYIPAKDFSAYEDQRGNVYVGIGVTISLTADGTGFEVEKVAAGAPAEEADIRVGDVIVAVEGKYVSEIGANNARDMIRGEVGTKVQLTILRDGKESVVSVTRKQFQTPVTTYEMLPENVGLITIDNFDDRCASETLEAIEALLGQGATKLIFDVRYNPGGYRRELVKVLDRLVPEGLIFRSEYYDGTVVEHNSDAKELNVPMAVLVNAESYSAAEFFAAALRDYDKAIIVGQKTCGKGYFQNTFKLSDGSAVGLSTGKYYTPKGVSLAGVGITPDIVVDNLSIELQQGIYYGTLDPMKDPQILAAIEGLKK